jgi:hypothetical protein
VGIIPDSQGGDDTLYGGAGNDRDSTQSSANILRFGAGVNKNNITLRLGSLMLDLGNGDEVHIGNFDQNDVFNSSTISSFEFVPSAGQACIHDERMRWRLIAETISNRAAANDELANAWRIAA